MAWKWRIRHKIILGMALVVGIMAFLLGGALKGLASYRSTMRTVDRRLAELSEADQLRAAVKMLAEPCSNLETQARELLDRLVDARKALNVYRVKLRETFDNDRDYDHGYREQEQLTALQQRFDVMEAALRKACEPQVLQPGSQSDLLAVGQPVRVAAEELIRTTGDLINIINSDLHRRIHRSKADYRNSLIVLLSASAAAVLLMGIILRLLQRGIVNPIRELERGVAMVAKGNFDHRIEIRSGDEIEDLANRYNDMASRLNEMYKDLAQQVNERSRQLVRSERLAGVGFLAAGVAHEINNPLASILFCSDALESRLQDLFGRSFGRSDPQDREIVVKYLKMIQEEAFRCKDITQKLLAFSRGGERKREKTDLREIVQGVLDVVQHLPNSKSKSVHFEAGEALWAWVNAQEIKQVFLNLVVNAMDSMDEGGSLTIDVRERDGNIELTFRDTGCGMSEEILENIFEPFFTRSRTGKGTGLGLSISHRIVSQHGGEISATSDGPNHGSTFVIRLPIEPPAEASEDAEVLDPETEFLKLNAAKKRKAA
ncbi:MAG: HAMP domain-containing protein [Gemmataceae bacterium]|nr:HAMP domain-containing protein [Gemmataceae bacterium]